MRLLIFVSILAGAQANLIFGRCSANSCENQANCVQFEPNRYYCQCIDSHHYGLRCEHKQCQNGDSSCETSVACDGPNCPSVDDICERDQPCLNDGICTNTASGFRCECPAGWAGPLCQLRQSCSTDPAAAEGCRNGGYCGQEGSCICPKGWIGTRCDEDVNECEKNPCENFGTCLNRRGGYVCACLDGFEGTRCETNTDDCTAHQCSPGSTCVDGLESYTCECPEGRGGRFCNETLACRSDTCKNGYCFDDSCVCDSGWTGAQCDTDLDECSLSPCAEGSQCINRNGSFECICAEGRTGLRCEQGTCSSHRECLNGGRCVGNECKCSSGFAGPNCQFEYRDPCENQYCTENKICVPDGKGSMLGFACECPRGFGGRLCTIPTNCSREDKTDSSACSLSGCADLAGNGICNQECNHFACGYDGGDCSAGTVPFSRCPDASFCARRFKDGRCDARCNNEKCLFDGFDCAGPEPEIRKNGTMTDITLTILVRPETFVRRVDEFLATLAARLRTTVTIKKTDGEMDVFQWNSASGEGPRVRFGSRTDARIEYRSPRARRSAQEEVFNGILVVIQVDLKECSRECFSDAQAVALFIGATEAKEPINPSMPIHSAIIQRQGTDKPKGETNVLAIILTVLVLATVVSAVVVVGVKRRHVIDAPVWTPPCKEAAREYYTPGIMGVHGYQGFQSYGEPAAKMPAPVFKARPAPETLPGLTELEQAANGEERVTPEMHQLAHIAGRYERTPLHWLALNTKKSSSDVESDCILLISFGIDVNKRDMDGNTALHYACENARTPLVRRLLAAGADPALDNELDMTPLHVAAKHADDACIEVLIAHKMYKDTAKFDAVDLEDRTALMLYAANSCQSIRGAELLLKAGADVNFAGDKKRSHAYRGRTALHHAAQFNKDNRKMIEFLVSRNANKDAQDVEEATPLWVAVNADNFIAVDELLRAGASLDFADQKERTPEGLAYEKGYAKISERLRVARLRCPIIGLSSFSSFPTRTTTIQAPRIIKKPTIKKFKSPTPSSEGTTPSPPGLKASSSSGPSFLDSPHSDQGRQSDANSSSEIGSPVYAPSCGLQQPMQQQAWQQSHPAAAATARPSPPYDTHEAGFHQGLPPLSLNQGQPCLNQGDYGGYYPQYQYNPPACAYSQQQQQ